ncbi:MAG: hypothetical protein JNL83_23970 [Myxococcales bacterium]|nr:hypothetical protein [Myxococcales bacterium]
MKASFWIGLGLAAAGLVVVVLGNTGDGISVPAILAGGVLFVLGGTMALASRAFAKAIRQAETAVRELETRGVRRTGTVTDIVVEPTYVIVKIQLDRTGGGGEHVTCYLEEDSESARARIGQPITVIEHPEHRTLRAIDGYLPNGKKRP